MRPDARDPMVAILSYSRWDSFSTPLRGICTFTKFILTQFTTPLKGVKQEMNF